MADAVLLPGAVLPAQLAYAGLIAALGDGVRAVVKDLELYAGPSPSGWALEDEVVGAERAADEAAVDRFHLVGYSAGGAAALLAAATRPERLLSLTLLEPAWAGAGDDLLDDEREYWREADRVAALPEDERLAAFVRMELRPGVEPPPPPPGDPPPWMALRPAGIAAAMAAFRDRRLPRDALRAFRRPVLYVLGGLSRPAAYERPAQRLAEVFDDFTLEVFADRHHFDPPHRAEPGRLAEILRRHWARAGDR